jgi:AcrR family transcriptional regulator
MEGHTERRTPEELRKQVIAAALRLFADRGYAGTSVQDIADAVGASKQLVLYHFGSKAEIRQVVIESIAVRWKDLLPVLLDVATRDSDRLDTALVKAQEFLRANPDALRFVLRDLISVDGEMMRLLQGLAGPWMRLTADSLDRARGTDDGAPRALARVQLVGVLLLALYAVFPPDEEAEDPALRGALYDEAATMIRRVLRGE